MTEEPCAALSACRQAHRVRMKGLLHESYAHERLKSSFVRKPAMVVVSRHPARTGLKASRSKVGLDDRESHGAQRAAWLASLQHQLSAIGSRILLADVDASRMVSAMSAEAIGSWS